MCSAINSQTVLAVLVGILAMLISLDSIFAKEPDNTPKVVDEVRVHSIVVVNSDGEVRARINDHGLTVYDEDEIPVAMYLSTLCSISAVEDSSRVLITGEKVEVQAEDDTHTLLLTSSSITGSVAHREQDQVSQQARFSASWSGGASIKLQGTNGVDRFVASISDSTDETTVCVYGTDGTLNAELKK